jgi:hypothetical protein
MLFLNFKGSWTRAYSASRSTIDCWIFPAMLIKASIVGVSRSATETCSSLVHMDAVRGPIALPCLVNVGVENSGGIDQLEK